MSEQGTDAKRDKAAADAVAATVRSKDLPTLRKLAEQLGLLSVQPDPTPPTDIEPHPFHAHRFMLTGWTAQFLIEKGTGFGREAATRYFGLDTAGEVGAHWNILHSK